MDVGQIKNLMKPESVLFDVKNLLPVGLADGAL